MERLNKLPKVSQLVKGGGGTEPKQPEPSFHLLYQYASPPDIGTSLQLCVCVCLCLCLCECVCVYTHMNVSLAARKENKYSVIHY